ncbi:hypothetical protein JY97_17605 [Alkalispirochaeta odontotermitis]|nr:hypothetical protein JY97_17605 [Alkalispirochaeta odontotermitis]CAB1074555.1 hypothetical protein D1AOALGA4SA_2374 [Olavius algarvensis Delta 1 endosymbiont]
MIKLLLEKFKKNHALAMIICCGIPIVGILALSSMGVLGSWGYYALILLCPIGHFIMMRGMISDSNEKRIPRQVEHSVDES